MFDTRLTLILAETSDTVQIATLLIGAVSTIFAGFISYKMAELNLHAKQAGIAAESAAADAAVKAEAVRLQAARAATAVEQVKITLHDTRSTLNDQLTALTAQGAKTLELVNGGMKAQLILHANTARTLAEITKEPADVEASKLASRLLSEHLQQGAEIAQREAVHRELAQKEIATPEHAA